MSTDTQAVRTVRRSVDALLAHDWDAYSDAMIDTFRLEDRRNGLKAEIDKAASVEMGHVVVDLGLDAVEIEVIETRGELLVLYLITAYAGDFVIPMLTVSEVSADGQTLRTVFFDEE